VFQLGRFFSFFLLLFQKNKEAKKKRTKNNNFGTFSTGIFLAKVSHSLFLAINRI